MTKKQCSIVKFNDTTFPLQSTKHRATRPELNCFREGYKKVGKYGIFMVLGCNYQRQGFTKEERAGSCSQQQVGGSAHLYHQVSSSQAGWNWKDSRPYQTGFSRGWRSLEGPGVDGNHATVAGKCQEQQKSSQWKEESRWDEGGGLLILVKPYFGKQARESTQGSS